MRSYLVATLALSALLPASAHAQWKEIGKTASDNPVYIYPSSMKTKDGITTARVQVKFVKPVDAGNGKTWRLSRHVAMFDCAKKTVAAKSTTYYSDAAGTKVVETKTIAMPGFGPAIGGSMTQIALDYVCANVGAKKR